MSANEKWMSVCKVDDLVDNSGVCALVNDTQVALFKLRVAGEDQVLAISNWDPFGEANVLYRGLVGSIKTEEAIEKYFVASPLYKQRFCLMTGECVDDPSASVSVYPARVVGDHVELGIAS